MSESSATSYPLQGGALEVTAAAAANVGNVRETQEDSLLCAAPIFIVADGMGGHAAGDVASRVTVEAFEPLAGEHAFANAADVIAAMEQANDRVLEIVAEDSDEHKHDGGAGTTLTGVVLVRDPGEYTGLYWMVLNVGDSRVYAFDGQRVAQVTVDHSAVQELVTLGRLTPEQAERHPDRNVVTRAIGNRYGVLPDLWLVPVAGHQRFVICSDGLTKELADGDIGRIVASFDRDDESAFDPQAAADALVEAALDEGGRDNVSVIVLDSAVVPDRADDGGASAGAGRAGGEDAASSSTADTTVHDRLGQGDGAASDAAGATRVER